MVVKTTTLLFLCTVLVGITTARKATIGVPSDIVGLWNVSPKPELMLTSYSKAGFSDDTGHFHKDKILALYEKSDKKEEIKAAVDACDKIAEKNPLETMYKVILCFFDKTPVLLEVKLD
ncbi:hypothetical protein RR46_07280 [Papilio xuthus]|uniref:Uncharacterized protein n=1 Tax=Papilio xuthus TaxID=66420 RepID=A0A194PWY8_PAPXU|nr:hypothetical protein RR46_07280 [Papilio xuthus]